MVESASTFNIDKFRRSEFLRREGKVNVPSLANFIDGDPIIEVQSLSGPEVFLAEQRKDHNDIMDEIISKLQGGNIKVQVEAVMEALGITDSVSQTAVKMIAYVEMGCKSIKFTQSDVVRLLEYKVDAFLSLFKKINSLTMMGYIEQGELNATGATPE